MIRLVVGDKEFEKAKVRLAAREVVGLCVIATLILAGIYLLLSLSDIKGFLVIMIEFAILLALLGTGLFLNEKHRGVRVRG